MKDSHISFLLAGSFLVILLIAAMLIAGRGSPVPNSGNPIENNLVEIHPDHVVVNTPECEIWIEKDGLVRRSAVRNDLGTALQWVFYIDGKHALSRNAKNELQYQPYRNGKYSAWVEQFVGGKYKVISNVIHFEK